MLHRTTVVLPARLKEKAVARAREQNISFGEFVRQAVEQQLSVRGKGEARSKPGDLTWICLWSSKMTDSRTSRSELTIFSTGIAIDL
jgi:hypothetical protein